MTHLATRIHYHVHNSQTDADPAIYYDTRDDANAALDEDAAIWRHELHCHVTGNATDGYDVSWSLDSHSHWRLYVQECTEPECTEPECTED